jgi:hypothetical protein
MPSRRRASSIGKRSSASATTPRRPFDFFAEERGEPAAANFDFDDRRTIFLEFAGGFCERVLFVLVDVLAEEPVAAFDFRMAVLFRFEESHRDAVERVAMVRAEAFAAERAMSAAVPGGGREGWHECDADGHREKRNSKTGGAQDDFVGA